ncbi:hypothetical protein SH449x_003962 [Pirellulaceae bacterium SH449]
MSSLFSVIADIAFVTIGLFAVAKLIHFLIARGDVRKQVFGEPICWWACGMYFLASMLGIVIFWDEFLRSPHAKEWWIMGALGLAAGVCIGIFHGGHRFDRMFPLTRPPE